MSDESRKLPELPAEWRASLIVLADQADSFTDLLALGALHEAGDSRYRADQHEGVFGELELPPTLQHLEAMVKVDKPERTCKAHEAAALDLSGGEGIKDAAVVKKMPQLRRLILGQSSVEDIADLTGHAAAGGSHRRFDEDRHIARRAMPAAPAPGDLLHGNQQCRRRRFLRRRILRASWSCSWVEGLTTARSRGR